MKLRLPVVKGQPMRSGTPTVTGAIPIKNLVNRYRIPIRRPLAHEGYQRELQQTRMRKFTKRLLDGLVDIPTAILMNLRHVKPSEVLVQDAEGQLFLEIDPPADDGDQNWFFIVDGQHRVRAAESAFNAEFSEHCENLELNFVLMIGASKDEELETFYVVNSEAKSVRTDLAFDLLRQLSDHDPKIQREIIESGQDWKTSGVQIAEILVKSSPVWKDRIMFANATSVEKKDAVVPLSSFVNSMKKLDADSSFRRLDLHNKSKVIDAFWQGIAIAYPVLIHGGDSEFGPLSPKDFVIQKGVGVSVLHEILPDVIQVLRENDMDVLDPNSHVAVVKALLEKLQGENKNLDPVSGVEFWLSTPRGGAAGAYSSSAGKRNLVRKLRSLLPENI